MVVFAISVLYFRNIDLTTVDTKQIKIFQKALRVNNYNTKYVEHNFSKMADEICCCRAYLLKNGK